MASEDSGEGIVVTVGEVTFVVVEVAPPGGRIPDLDEVHRSDDHALLVESGVVTVGGREGDPALLVQLLLVRARREIADISTGSGVGP